MLVALALVGAFMLLRSTPWGIGLTPDSVIYLGQANDLLHHRGYSQATYMPGFPFLVAGIGKFGVKPLLAARLTQCLLFACNIILAGALVHLATKSIPAGLIAAGLVLLSPDILQIHFFALSEPLFIALILLAALVLVSHLRSPAIWKMLLVGVTLGLAYLTRYAGVAFIGATILALLILQRNSPKTRLIHIAVVIAMAGIAMGLWMVRNHMLGRAAAGRPMVWHPFSPHHLIDTIHQFIEWIVPKDARSKLALPVAVIGAIGAFFGAQALLKPSSRNTDVQSAPVAQDFDLPLLMGLFAVVYLAFLVVSISLFDFGTPMDVRIMSPALICIIIGVSALLARVQSSTVKIAAIAFATFLVILWGDARVKDLSLAHRNGLGYASPQWKKSPTLAVIRKLPKDTQIYTNMWDVITILADRPARTVPNHKIVVQNRANPNFENEMRSVIRDMRTGHTILVMFNKVGGRTSLASTKDFQQRSSLRTVRKNKDGVIYAAGEPSTTTTRSATTRSAATRSTTKKRR